MEFYDPDIIAEHIEISGCCAILQHLVMLSRSAARLTRHRAFDFGGGRQVGELKNQPKRNPKTTAKNVMADKWANAKNKQKTIQKPSKIIKNRVWDHPGGSRGRLGDQFGPRAAQGSKRAPKSREILLRFWAGLLQHGALMQVKLLFCRCS